MKIIIRTSFKKLVANNVVLWIATTIPATASVIVASVMTAPIVMLINFVLETKAIKTNYIYFGIIFLILLFSTFFGLMTINNRWRKQ